MINCYLEELKRNFNNVYSSTDNVLIEHIEYLLIFLKDCKKTNFIITQLKNDEYYTEWEPIESKHAIGGGVAYVLGLMNFISKISCLMNMC